jgi:hypothetical protein
VIPSLTSQAPMSSSQNPARGNNDAGAPPPPPPQYSDVPNIELRDDEAASSSQRNVNTQPQYPPPPPPRSNTKNEASSYVGSYRPSDAQTPIPSVPITPAAQAPHADIPLVSHLQYHTSIMARISSSARRKLRTPTNPHLHTPSFLDNSTMRMGWGQTQ